MVGCTPCLTEAIDEIEKSGSDVVLVDPVNGEPCDFFLLESIVQRAPTAKVILINMAEDEAIFLRAVCSGVVGYLLQRASAMDVVAAVRSVYQGGAVCPPGLCRALFQRLASHGLASLRARTRRVLTRREQELMPLIGRGLTNKEIAAQLNLSEKTVKNHVHRILRRVNATDRFAAVEIALDRKLLPCSLMPLRPS
jgi:two-component system, NarL family, response regulator DevR